MAQFFFLIGKIYSRQVIHKSIIRGNKGAPIYANTSKHPIHRIYKFQNKTPQTKANHEAKIYKEENKLAATNCITPDLAKHTKASQPVINASQPSITKRNSRQGHLTPTFLEIPQKNSSSTLSQTHHKH